MSILLPGAKPIKFPAAVDLDTGGLVQEIWTKGTDATWELAARCPCAVDWEPTGSVSSGLTSTPQADCPACFGAGYYYYSSQQIRAVFLQSTGKPLLDQRFLNEMGSVAITTLPEHPVSPFDRLTPLSTYWRFNEIKVRTGTVETLRFPVVPQTLTVGVEGDLTTHTTITRGVLQCFSADTTGTVIYDGGSPEEWVEGVNFEITDAGLVDWSIGGGSIPALGTRVSYAYWCRPRYIISEMRFLHRMTFFQEKGQNHTLSRLPHAAVGRLDGIGT